MNGKKFVVWLIIGIVIAIAFFFTCFMLIYFNVFRT